MSITIELTEEEYDVLIKELKELDESSEEAIASSKELIEKIDKRRAETRGEVERAIAILRRFSLS